LCRRHHRAVHEGGFDAIRHRDGSITFLRPNGTVLEAAPALPARGSEVDVTLSIFDMPVWDGTPFDVVYAIDVLYQRSSNEPLVITSIGPTRSRTP
jgi:hypothetical protein